ncbi:nucleolar transcription factor 1-like isoform X2 [Ctenocephalides felis]|uniref:nucleolar transcription factor 1-like isoform X2 n=1 Tax=Ctenocephalides felis TaxID=7515 RepID=UPI000E6E2B22|nr:nucleolar transcription factor 1-like isoform X2 [Ctenocephalides felis]
MSFLLKMGVKKHSDKADDSIISSSKLASKKKSDKDSSFAANDSISKKKKSDKDSSFAANDSFSLKKKSDKDTSLVANDSFTTKTPKSSKSTKTPKSSKKSISEDTLNISKKAKKSQTVEIKTDDTDSSENEIFQPKQKNKKSKKDKAKEVEPPVRDVELEKHEESSEAVGEYWPEADLNELFTQIENVLPKNDNMNFKTRADGLDWEKIAFKMYSAQDCRIMWESISKKLRGFRLLQELLDDAKVWSKTPWRDYHKKNKLHPDMPKKPPTTYMLYFKQVYEKYKKKNPNDNVTDLTKKISEKYRNLSEDKKAKYTKMYAESKAKYETDLDNFYKKHPDLKPASRSKGSAKVTSGDTDPSDGGEGSSETVKTSKKGAKSGQPTKPLAPFRLFFEDMLRKENRGDVDKASFQSNCREIWNKMNDEEKGVWINLSVKNEDKYKEQLETMKSENPDSTPAQRFKSCLTKDEIIIRDRLLGKPDKPPNSAYTLFSTMLLNSEELKMSLPKDRMLLISQQWRSLDPKEKKAYEDRVISLKEAYKVQYAEYLNSLSPQKRKEELEDKKKNTSKKHKLDEDANDIDEVEEVNNTNAKKKVKLEKVEKLNMKLYDGEPEAPPNHPSILFAKTYRGNESTAQAAWKSLSAKTQNKYKKRLEEMKQKYMTEYEEFLKNLDEDQLQDYSKFIQVRDGVASSSLETSSDSSEEGSDSSSDEEDEDPKQIPKSVIMESDDPESDSSSSSVDDDD